MFKEVAKSSLARLVPHLPWGARQVIFDALLAEQGAYATMQKLALDFNIVGFMVQGEYGTIQGPSTDSAIMQRYGKDGTWSKTTNAVLGEFLSEGGTLLDVGANIGLTTIPTARNPKVRVISFEPAPDCFAYLERNVADNCPHGNVTPHRLAVYKEKSSLRFELVTAGNHCDNRIHGSDAPGALQEEERKVIEVPAAPLDDFDVTAGPLAVKIDTQGAEPFVVEGGRRTLDKAGLICIEYSPYMMARTGADPNIMLDFLRGFRSIAVGKEEAPVERHIADEAVRILSRIDPKNPHDYADLLLRR